MPDGAAERQPMRDAAAIGQRNRQYAGRREQHLSERARALRRPNRHDVRGRALDEILSERIVERRQPAVFTVRVEIRYVLDSVGTDQPGKTATSRRLIAHKKQR